MEQRCTGETEKWRITEIELSGLPGSGSDSARQSAMAWSRLALDRWRELQPNSVRGGRASGLRREWIRL